MASDSAACRHQGRKHAVWWWVEDGDPVPVPRMATYDNRADAMRDVERAIHEPPIALRWVKVFRADNEVYECFRWENPEPLPEPEPPVVPQVSVKRRWRRRGR